MIRSSQRFLVGALAIVAAACAESTTRPVSTSLSDAFLTPSVGFSAVNSSFSTSADSGPAWVPGREGGHDHGGPGFGGGMCGGFDDAYLGGLGFGPGHGRGPFGGSGLSGNCAFVTATGRVTCDPITQNGLTIVRSAAYTNAAGTVQTAFDSLTTNTINARVDVTGTITYGAGMGHGFRLGIRGTITDSIISATTTVANTSNRTVTGLASGSTQRTVNGTSAGNEATTGTTTAGAFSITRVMGDTTTGLKIPVTTSGPTYPIAGTVIRSMRASVTAAGATTASSRREVVTYDGTATAKIVITQDGTTKNCTLPLPHGHPVCS
ncbi:MAG: hypothetical protein M3081_01045 [Gemmatimonadota bacterium]|nr:hypothetical protein [Gemmatimonadota bacterium]